MHSKITAARNLAALIGALALVSCANPPPKQTFADITWSHLPPFKFNVAKVEVASEYKPSFSAPYVEHLFPTPPEKVVRRWIQDRVAAAGHEGFAKVIINDASVKETDLQHPKNFASHFTVEQGERYEVTIDVTLEIHGARGYRDGFTNAHIVHTQTVPENATLNERDRFWYDLTDGAMQDFNTQMEQNIAAYLQRFLAQ